MEPAAAQLDDQYRAKMEALAQQRQVLMSEEVALVLQGATPDQLNAWHQQNAPQLNNIDQQARNLSQSRPITANPAPVTPANASAEMTEYLQNQATLNNSFVQLHNQNLATQTAQTTVASPTMDDGVIQLWQQQNAALMQRQSQLSAVIGNQEAQTVILAPPPLTLPPNASAQLQAFLTMRDQLLRAQIQVLNQYRLSDPATRAAAVQEWLTANAANFAQLAQQAQALSSTPGGNQ